MQFGVNHLGHVLLSDLLVDALKRGAPARIVNVSSCFHDKAMGREGTIVLDDLNFSTRAYDGWTAYAQSKLANVLHAKGLAKRLEGSGVTAVSVHPGWVRTNLGRHIMPVWVQDYLLRPALRLMGMIEPWEGAQSSLYAVLAEEVQEHPGAYFSQLGVYRDKAYSKGGWPMQSPNPLVDDEALADALWDKSRALVGLTPT
jgi:NAD(P)-dependent dehydrogenase (short-subunit alcohol dehydrogenase family)